MAYAENTTVNAEKSKADIEKIIRRFGGNRFMSGWDDIENYGFVVFDIQNLRLRFTVPMPDHNEGEITDTGRRRKKESAEKVREQEMKRRWRSLLLVIKAKLEAVETGISTIEHEFLANVVLPNGETIGSKMVPKVKEIAESGQLPKLIA